MQMYMLYYEPAFELKNYCTRDCIVSLCNFDSLIIILFFIAMWRHKFQVQSVKLYTPPCGRQNEYTPFLKEIFDIFWEVMLGNINALEYAVDASNIYDGNMNHLFNQNLTTEGFLE